MDKSPVNFFVWMWLCSPQQTVGEFYVPMSIQEEFKKMYHKQFTWAGYKMTYDGPVVRIYPPNFSVLERQ